MSDADLNPLVSRYASQEMLAIFSSKNQAFLYRSLWLQLAKAQKELGISSIKEEHLAILEQSLHKTNFEKVRHFEEKLRHDVMAHLHALTKEHPSLSGVVHLGATSVFVKDNTSLIQIKQALTLLEKKIAKTLASLGVFALKYADLPTLSYTHMQPAQPSTVGKRATLWAQSLLMDLEEVKYRIKTLPFRGVKGTTGTQASFFELFSGDYQKTKALDTIVAKAMGFSSSIAVCGQTYDRKIDTKVLDALSGIAQSGHKFTNDLRLLQFLKEIEEPFEKTQVGSSAMPYKRNPMRSERLSSLCKFVMTLSESPKWTAATQWMERTMDDSANRRLFLPQAFLAVDALMDLWGHLADSLVVYPKVIQSNLEKELPFMLTENVLMKAVSKGCSRQEAHEIIRIHAMEAGKRIKEEGKPNNLWSLLSKDKRLGLSEKDYQEIWDEKHLTGFSKEQTELFVHEHLNPLVSSISYQDIQNQEPKI